jgi:hypothetical protein
MAAVLPTSAEIISPTQTNAQQKVDLAALVDFAAENTNKGTTGGTSTAYTLTLVPALTVLEAGQRFRVLFNAANGATPTLNVNGLGAVALKVYNSSGAKVDPAVGALALNMLSDVEYDGTDYVVMDQLPPAAAAQTSEAYVYIREQQASGVSGGTSGSTRQVRTLNTEVSDAAGVATLASNQITLTAGTYRFQARAPAYRPGRHQLRLRNVTAGATLSVGSTAYSDTTAVSQSDSFVRGRFTVAASQALELQHYIQSGGADGLGVASSSGDVEVYTEIEFWKEF